MERQMEPCQLIERSIIKKYRKELWTPFIVAVKRYELVQAGDKIAVCISGGKDSMLMAKLMQELQRHSDVPFELVFLVMDPGYAPENRKKIEENAAALGIPIHKREIGFAYKENLKPSKSLQTFIDFYRTYRPEETL